jgi:cell wall-associated NlpC family hydrolase
MRRLLLAVAGFGAVTVSLPAVVMVIGTNDAPASAAATAVGGSCTVRPAGTDRGTIRAAVTLDAEQMNNARAITAVASSRRLPERAAAIALMTAMQESSLTNVNHGDLAGPTSRGLFQQKPEFYPGVDVTDPAAAAAAFYDRLIAVPGYLTLPMPQAAQAVQRSADPSRYARWQPLGLLLAAELYGHTTGQLACTGGRPDVDVGAPSSLRVAAALTAAQTQLGRPYRWGGGNANGPTAGPPPGFDCSGLTIYAWAHAGVTLTHSSRQQYNAGTRVPLADARAGDLIFLANNPADPNTIHHVAMITAPGQIIEAQTTGVPVHIRPFADAAEPQIMPYVVRLIP